jgi:hypothetical protein
VTVATAGWTSLHCTIPQHGMSNSTHKLTRKGAWQLAYGSKKENDSRIAVAERWHDVFTVAAPAALPCSFCTAVSSGGERLQQRGTKMESPSSKGSPGADAPTSRGERGRGDGRRLRLDRTSERGRRLGEEGGADMWARAVSRCEREGRARQQ